MAHKTGHGPARYAIGYKKPAKRALSHDLPEAVAAAAFEFCEGALAANPHRVGGQLHGPLAGYHGAHKGTYRVVYIIHDDQQVVSVEWIDHRADVFRPR